jgi:hypothetical protein
MEPFKVGDIVEYYKEPTYEDWIGVGEIAIRFQIGDHKEVKAICPHSSALMFEDRYFYPKQCFRIIEKAEPEFIFNI